MPCTTNASTPSSSNDRVPHRRLWRRAWAFALLVVTYQLPEGLGQRWLHDWWAVAGLFALFYACATVVAWCLGPTLTRCYALETKQGLLTPCALLVVSAVLLKGVAVAIGIFAGWYARQPLESSVGPSAVLLVLVMTAVPSIAEDIVTRGFWYRRVWARSPLAFVLGSTVIYVLNHIYRLGLGPGEWIMLTVFGLAYGLAVVRFDSLWPAVAAHWGWNVANALTDLVQPVTVVNGAATRGLSIAAHLLVCGVVWRLSRASWSARAGTVV